MASKGKNKETQLEPAKTSSLVEELNTVWKYCANLSATTIPSVRKESSKIDTFGKSDETSLLDDKYFQKFLGDCRIFLSQNSK